MRWRLQLAVAVLRVTTPPSLGTPSRDGALTGSKLPLRPHHNFLPSPGPVTLITNGVPPINSTPCLASTVYTDILKTLTRVVWYYYLTITLVKTVAAEDGSP